MFINRFIPLVSEHIRNPSHGASRTLALNPLMEYFSTPLLPSKHAISAAFLTRACGCHSTGICVIAYLHAAVLHFVNLLTNFASSDPQSMSSVHFWISPIAFSVNKLTYVSRDMLHLAISSIFDWTSYVYLHPVAPGSKTNGVGTAYRDKS